MPPARATIPTSTTGEEPILLIPSRKLVQLELDLEIAPGVITAKRRRGMAVPRTGIHTWRPTGDGSTYVPVIETHPSIIPLKMWDEKVYGCSKKVVRILVAAGFVEGEALGPRTLMIHLDSWHEHRERMRANPWFWQDSANLARYHKARVLNDGKKGKRSQGKPLAPQIDSAASRSVSAVVTGENGQRVSRGTAKGQGAAGKD